MKFILKGPEVVNGEIGISGSKNSSLPIIAGALLTKEEVIIKNVPLITDVTCILKILDDLGVEVDYNYPERTLYINAKKIVKNITSDSVKNLRASYYLISPLIHRKKEFEIDYPGGCNFGKRPIDQHLNIYKQMGIDICEQDKLYFKRKKINPIVYDFPIITVGGTINAILALVLVKGESYLSNVAIEPEVIDVINFLNSMGAKIEFIETRKIKIIGVNELHQTTYKVMPDRIEAGSFMLLALAKPNSSLTINNIDINHLQNIIDVITRLNAKIELSNDSLKITSPKELNNIEITTGPYPSFPTDLQPILSTILLRSIATSKIIETIYPTRNAHVQELKKMKANISMTNGTITINPSRIQNGIVFANDLRCGFAMIVAGLMTNKQLIINKADYILRGYENIIEKLENLNINCKKEYN